MKIQNKTAFFITVESLVFLAIIAGFLPKIMAPAEAEQGSGQVLGVETVALRGQQLEAKAIPHFAAQGSLETSSVSAASFLVYDATTGQVLAEKNAQANVPIASLTKLLTVLLAEQQLGPDAVITVTPNDLINVSPVLHLKVGDEVKVSDLITAIMVGSANDAAQTLGNALEKKLGSPIASIMNDLAGRIGMSRSHFSNPLGFDSDANFSNAQDLRTLVTAVSNYIDFKVTGRKLSYDFTSTKGSHYGVRATNKLIRQNPDVYAIKTGYTESAGQTMITGFVKDGHDIVIIVLDSQSRDGDTSKLKAQIQKHYELKQ